MTEHLASMIECNGKRLGLIQFRKFYGWYTKGLPAKALKVKAFRAATHEEMQEMIDRLIECEKFIREGRFHEKNLEPQADHCYCGFPGVVQ